MGEIIVRKVKGMNWKAKISLVLIFTMVFSTFMYQGWYAPKKSAAAIATYDFSTGAGTNKWAYWENDALTAVPPAARTTVNTQLSGANYTAIGSDNAAYFANAGSWNDANGLRMDINIAEAPAGIDSMVVTFNGRGEAALTLNTYIWNYNTSSWQIFGNTMSIGTGDTNATATYNPAGDFTNFVSGGQITIVITDSTTANLNWDVDYVKLDINYTPPCVDPDPSTITIPAGQTANGSPYNAALLKTSTGDVGSFEYRVIGPLTTATYDFSTGAGVNKWAYHENNTNTAVPPTTRTTVATQLTAGNYTSISTDNAAYFADAPSFGDANAIRMDINIAQAPATIDSMVVTFNGYGGTALTLRAYIWNYTLGSWQAFDTASMSIGTSDATGTSTYNPTGDFTDFVNAGQVTIVVTDTATGNQDTWNVDYLKLDVNYIPICTNWTSNASIPATTAGGSLCGDYTNGGTYTLDVRGTDPDCATSVTTTPTSFTWNACSDPDPATLTTTNPASSSTVNGTVMVQTQVGTEADPANMTGVVVNITGSDSCNVTNGAMTWNSGSGRWEYSWNTSACGTVTTDTGVSITVSGTDIDCNSTVTAAAVTNVTIDNRCTDPDPATLTTTSPTSGTTVNTTKVIQVQVGAEATPSSMTGMVVNIANAGACNVTNGGMLWNAGASRWEYSWNTSACGTVTPVTGVTISVRGTDPDCNTTVNAAVVNNITIDNRILPHQITSCGDCHGNPPVDSASRNSVTGRFPGSHDKHASGSGYGYVCTTCHTSNASYNHRNRNIEVISPLAGVSGSYGKGTSFAQVNDITGAGLTNCSNTYCHSAGTGGTSQSGDSRGVAANTSPTWGNNGTIDCASCHGFPPSYSSGKANSHAAHPSDCSLCHNATTTDGATITDKTKHANRTYDIVAGGGVTISSYVYALGGGTCNSISCHGGGNAQWGAAGSVNCLTCHAAQQGNRVAVVGQFSSNSHHVQGVALTTQMCYQCHWEANSDGTTNSTYHSGPSAPGSPVNLVIYGTTARPSGAYSEGVNGIAYTASTQTRAELAKINTHCMGCHDDDSATATPFGDGKTPITYAWDGSSVAKRYTQAGTTTWGKYAATTNAAQKNLTKAYSAHGNAANNARGWSATTGVDGAITNSSGNVNVLCFDCHNSHGSATVGTTTSYTSATTNGGILKTTTNGLGGYSVTYTPAAGGSAATKNAFNAGAALCFDCHQNANAGAPGPWGYNTTFNATQPIISYWEKSSQWYGAAGVNPAGPQVRFGYKNTRQTAGTHFGASSALTHANAPTQMGTIKGLCTPCHDPHGVTDNTTKILAADKQYAVPLLKGTWMTSPYKEDFAPLSKTEKRGGSSRSGEQAAYAGASTPGYHIDQNTFETIATSTSTTGDWVWPGTNKISQADTQFGGLCLQCHAKADINPNSASPGAWQSMDRIHNTVKGWATAGSGANVNNAIHAFSCSKCHTPHSACLPRLMVSNCLDVGHRGQVNSGGASGGATQTAGSRGQGQGRFPGGGGGGWASNASCRLLVPNGGVGAWFAGNSLTTNTMPTLNQCHNVANAGGTSHPTSQIWNAKTPWTNATD